MNPLLELGIAYTALVFLFLIFIRITKRGEKVAKRQ